MIPTLYIDGKVEVSGGKGAGFGSPRPISIHAFIQNYLNAVGSGTAQTLSIAGSTLSISGGNSVTLPTGNFATNDLTATANRTHNFNSSSLTVSNLTGATFQLNTGQSLVLTGTGVAITGDLNVSNSNFVPQWQANTAYPVDAVVLNGTIIYKKINAGTSGGTFAPASWTQIGGGTPAGIDTVLDQLELLSADREIDFDGNTFTLIDQGTVVAEFTGSTVSFPTITVDSDTGADISTLNAAGVLGKMNLAAARGILAGTTDPINTTTTAWYVGQLYLNTVSGELFQATTTSANPDGSGVGSVWASIPIQETTSVITTDGTALGVTHSGVADHIANIILLSTDVNNDLTIGTDGGLHMIDIHHTHISRANTTTGIIPTALEVLNPIIGFTATVRLTSDVVEAYTHNGTTWILDYTQTPVTLDGNMVHVSRANTITGVEPTIIEVPAPINGDTVIVFLSDGTREFWSHNGVAWALNATVAAPVLSNAISPASDDAIGAIGVTTDLAREDHKHPAQGISADANNLLSIGTDGLHMANPVTIGADAISPAADDTIGAIGVINQFAREDHKHPAQSVSADLNNNLSVSATDGLHYYDDPIEGVNNQANGLDITINGTSEIEVAYDLTELTNIPVVDITGDRILIYDNSTGTHHYATPGQIDNDNNITTGTLGIAGTARIADLGSNNLSFDNVGILSTNALLTQINSTVSTLMNTTTGPITISPATTMQLNSANSTYILGDGSGGNIPTLDSDSTDNILTINTADNTVGSLNANSLRCLVATIAPIDGTTTAYFVGQLYWDRTNKKMYEATAKSTDPDTAGTGSTFVEIPLGHEESVINQINFVTSEPVAPTIGDRYINTTTGNSSGTTQVVTEHVIYEWNGVDWTATTPTIGVFVYDQTLGGLTAFDGLVWIPLTGVSVINDLADVDTTTITPVVGWGLTWDGTNWVPTELQTSGDIIDITTASLSAFTDLAISPWQSLTTDNGGNVTDFQILLTNDTIGQVLDVNVYTGEGIAGTLVGTMQHTTTAINTNTAISFTGTSGAIDLGGNSIYTFEVILSSGGGTAFWRRDTGNPYPDGRSSQSATEDNLFRLETLIQAAAVIVEDNLVSVSTTNALSANKGTELRTVIGTTDGDLTMGTYTGQTLTDNQTVKINVQELETAVETRARNYNILRGDAITGVAPIVGETPNLPLLASATVILTSNVIEYWMYAASTWTLISTQSAIDTNLFTPGGLTNTASVTHTDDFGFTLEGDGDKTITTTSGLSTNQLLIDGGIVRATSNDGGAGTSATLEANGGGSITIDASTGVYSMPTTPITNSDAPLNVLIGLDEAFNELVSLSTDRFEELSGVGSPIDGGTFAWYIGQEYKDTTTAAEPIYWYATTASTNPDVAAAGSVWQEVTSAGIGAIPTNSTAAKLVVNLDSNEALEEIADGSNHQVLRTDGAGILSFESPTGIVATTTSSTINSGVAGTTHRVLSSADVIITCDPSLYEQGEQVHIYNEDANTLSLTGSFRIDDGSLQTNYTMSVGEIVTITRYNASAWILNSNLSTLLPIGTFGQRLATDSALEPVWEDRLQDLTLAGSTIGAWDLLNVDSLFINANVDFTITEPNAYSATGATLIPVMLFNNTTSNKVITFPITTLDGNNETITTITVPGRSTIFTYIRFSPSSWRLTWIEATNRVIAKSANYTTVATDTGSYLRFTAGVANLHSPNVEELGNEILIRNANASSMTVTSAGTLNGATTINQHETISAICIAVGQWDLTGGF